MNYTVSEEVLNQVLGYLGSRPYVEVAAIVNAISTGAKVVQDANGEDATAPQAAQPEAAANA